MTPETTRGSIKISVMTPASWVDLELDPDRRDASVARLVAERTGLDCGPLGAELAELFSRTAAEARGQGALFASVFSDAFDDQPVSASLVVSGRSQLAMLSFTTPTLALGDAFAELFDAMAETLSWT